MCQVGDIILIDRYNSNGENIAKHSFIVLSDKNGEIQFRVIGSIKEDIFNLLLEFIQELKEKGVKFERITDNLQ